MLIVLWFKKRCIIRTAKIQPRKTTSQSAQHRWFARRLNLWWARLPAKKIIISRTEGKCDTSSSLPHGWYSQSGTVSFIQQWPDTWRSLCDVKNTTHQCWEYSCLQCNSQKNKTTPIYKLKIMFDMGWTPAGWDLRNWNDPVSGQ